MVSAAVFRSADEGLFASGAYADDVAAQDRDVRMVVVITESRVLRAEYRRPGEAPNNVVIVVVGAGGVYVQLVDAASFLHVVQHKVQKMLLVLLLMQGRRPVVSGVALGSAALDQGVVPTIAIAGVRDVSP
jgi:dethiobiotin synthetase